jgi:acetylornithine deacetylase/succinyl-diaminopimelate desuccinylase-like protein
MLRITLHRLAVFFPLVLFLLVFSSAVTPGSAQDRSAPDRLARDIYEQLVNINTSPAAGTTRAAEGMAKRLLDAGFPPSDVRVLGAQPDQHNLVARLRGSGSARPVLLLAHLDVVEARKEDWSVDPFVFLEKDGYFYGRGTTDDKAQAAIWMATVIRLKQEGVVPNRDLIVALTADEEGGGPANGVAWLLKTHPELIDAEYCLNEGGGGRITRGKKIVNEVQAAEKHYATFVLEVTNKGGHSSLPQKDNAIYRLAQAVSKLSDYDFPVHLTEVTRAFFERTAAVVGGQDGADMKAVTGAKPDPAAAARLSKTALYNALLRTTCIPTRLDAGHAENALPQMARATINCRVIPSEDPADVRATLERLVDDPAVSVTASANSAPVSPASPLRPELMEAIEQVNAELFPGVPVIPVMSTGATDGAYLRTAGVPTYGVSGLFEDIDDVRAHGRDERLGVSAFYEAREFLYRLIRAVTK